MRLIDGDALKRKMQKVATEAWKMKLNAPIEKTFNQCIDYIDSAPTIKPKQGEWIKRDIACYRCSECGKIQIADDINELNYCCFCGSRNKIKRIKGADDEHDK